MINLTSEEVITTAPGSAAKTSNQSSIPQKLNARMFDFLWWRDSRRKNDVLKKKKNRMKKEDLIEVKIVESKKKNSFSNKATFDFFKNIKKHMQFKQRPHRSKQKMKEIEASNIQNDINCDSSMLQINNSTITAEEDLTELKCDDITKNSSVLSNSLSAVEASDSACISENLNDTVESCTDVENKLEIVNVQVTDKLDTNSSSEDIFNEHQTCSNNQLETKIIENPVVEHQIANVEEIAEASISNDNKVKASLTEELLKLSNYGWYWGPISGNEADAKLLSEPDGAFLVRDSSDDRYVLTLSFKSSGKLLHARMEHSGGLFSLCNQSESEGFSTVADLIHYSMNFSQSAVFCYSRPKYPGHPSFPVRLTKPVSRFTQVRSLQYLCRFVIRQNTRLDNIHKLPLPKTIKGYIEEAHY
ncbi:uncharacterized protein LOC143431242 [Xylocopa sonorina]|uniref:uncharacterized protein LOC143431242 n=1 Tax=Xylocopa sonorina TaxID=1818115 RepID=UPI00403A83B6